MPGHSKWRDVVHQRDEQPLHRFLLTYTYRPWWGLGLIVHEREFELTYTGDEADALRSLARVVESVPHPERVTFTRLP